MSCISRRQWLVACGGATLGAGLGLVSRGVTDSIHERSLIRPPGAASEHEFLAACIRCGQCVQACPYDTLELAALNAGLSAGTPYAGDLRGRPCYLCRKNPEPLCIKACPTKALSPVATLLEIRMGTAILNPDTCWATNGVTCRSCWHACPWPDEALKLNSRLHPEVDAQTCIGCGLCEHACPTEPSSIVIEPPSPNPGQA